MHINDVRLIATEVLRTPSLIAVANRETKLSDTMAAELAALDRAAAEVVSGQPGMRGVFPTDPEWELLDALEAAAGGYRAMREMRNGLACDANAGGMTGAALAGDRDPTGYRGRVGRKMASGASDGGRCSLARLNTGHIAVSAPCRASSPGIAAWRMVPPHPKGVP